MAYLRGNLHAHTTLSDGLMPPEDVVAAYEALGYDFLAITDHEDRVGRGYGRRLRRLRAGLLLFEGIELGCPDYPQHVGRVRGEGETLHVLNHPGRYQLSLEGTLERLAALGREGIAVDVVEVSDTGRYRPEYDVAAIHLPKIATDDSHRQSQIGRAWIEVEAQRSRDAILRAVKAGDFRLGFAPEVPASRRQLGPAGTGLGERRAVPSPARARPGTAGHRLRRPSSPEETPSAAA